MKIRVLGGGWYGCHIALALIREGHDVELHEIAGDLFAGASGGNPARLHLGFHYPRSRLTRAACQEHHVEFMAEYGELTEGVPINIYAIAAHDSLVDFGTYRQVLQHEVQFVEIHDPDDYGLRNVEGALLTGERHIVIDRARAFFLEELRGHIRFRQPPTNDGDWDLTVDCTFCARDAEAVDRYEPCIVGLLEGPIDKAVTIMDGGFPSVYPWDEDRGLSSLSSATLTPISKTARTYTDAVTILAQQSEGENLQRCERMLDQMAQFWPDVATTYRIAGYRKSIRAMPRSGADARLVDVVKPSDRTLRVRAGKIDAIFRAERLVIEAIEAWA